MKKASLLIIGLFVAVATFAQSTWAIDKSHSSIKFNVTHMVISETSGNFEEFEGAATTTSDDFDGADISFNAAIASINTGDEKRDGHLKADDFFNAEKFPHLSFKGKLVKKGSKYTLVGDFTMRDVTKKVEFPVKYNGTVTDPYGNVRGGFKVNGEVDRQDYGISFSGVLAAGGALVSDDVEIVCNIELVKNK